MRSTLMCCALASMLLFSGPAPNASLAGAPSSSETTPVGRWQTVDDATAKVKAVVSIWEEHGKVYGKIERILDPSSTDFYRPRSPVRPLSGRTEEQAIDWTAYSLGSPERWCPVVWRESARSGEWQNLQVLHRCGRGRKEAQSSRLHRLLSLGSHTILAPR